MILGLLVFTLSHSSLLVAAVLPSKGVFSNTPLSILDEPHETHSLRSRVGYLERFNKPPYKMDFLIKFAQYHESFRQAEIEALAVVEKVDLTVLSYDADVSHSLYPVA
jgi:hypothetical protein